MRAKEFIIEQAPLGLDAVPPEPGTAPIPPGTVRLYHQTSEEALRSILQHGLLLTHARGIEGPYGIYASEWGFYGPPGSKPTLEFYVNQNKWHDPFVLEDVMPDQMIAVHLPWHKQARRIESAPKLLQSVLSGKFDHLTGRDKQAVEYIKRKYQTQ